MHFGVLGPLQASIGGQEAAPGTPRHARVLALLLLEAGRVVPVQRMVDAAWEQDGPATAVRQIQDAVSWLRKRLVRLGAPPELISTHPGGYRFHAPAAQVDVLAFMDERGAAARCGDPAQAVDGLRRALAFWRGPALLGLGGRVLESEAARLEALRASSLVTCLSLELELGRHRAAADELTALLHEHPYDERIAELTMLALYRSGRRGQTLALYRDVSVRLIEELGVEPGPDLQQLHRRILDEDPSLAAPVHRASPAVTPHPIAAPRVIPRQLPADLADFTGRGDDLARLATLLAAGTGEVAAGPVLLCALGGVGKSTLAVHAAHRAAAHYPDGQLQVDLRGSDGPPADPASVLTRFLRGLGVRGPEIPADGEERAALYRSILADRRVLVLLDDARDAAQVRPLLPGAGRSAVLVTSRSSLPGLDGASRLALEVLPPAEAMRLLERILGASTVHAEPESARTVLSVCGGLPLAIRIAAARAAEPGAGFGMVAGELATQRSLLDAFESEDRAVRATFAASYRALAPEQARAFRLMSLNAGPHLSRDAAAALFGLPVPRCAALLSGLARVHLIRQAGPGRFTLHDLLRVYAGERAALEEPQDALEQARTRLLTWYLHASAAAARVLGPSYRQVALEAPAPHCAPPEFADFDGALAWHLAEQANLHAAIITADRAGYHEIAWKLPVTMWRPEGYEDDATQSIRGYEIALAGTRALRDAEAESWVLNRLAGEFNNVGRFADAERALLEALELRRAGGDLRGEASCLITLGNTLIKSGRAAQALGPLEQAVELCRAIPFDPGERAAHTNLGEAHMSQGHLELALAHHVKAHELLHAMPPDPMADGRDLANLAEILRLLNRLPEAARRARRAHVACVATGNRIDQAISANVLAQACAADGKWEDALAFWREAGQIFTELDDERATQVRERIAETLGVIRARG